MIYIVKNPYERHIDYVVESELDEATVQSIIYQATEEVKTNNPDDWVFSDVWNLLPTSITVRDYEEIIVE